MSSIEDQLFQLDEARKLVLADVSLYPEVVRGILPIIAPSQPSAHLRRWGAAFLAEALATPSLPTHAKETMQPVIMDTILAVVENAAAQPLASSSTDTQTASTVSAKLPPPEDLYVLESILQAAASCYPITLRWIIDNAYDTTTWESMTAVKKHVLQIWSDETRPMPVRLACLKFAQCVVLAQTPGRGPDDPQQQLATRRSHLVNMSLDRIPPEHSLLKSSALEAEAQALLDRMLSVLRQHSTDALLVDATLNLLGVLFRLRPTVAAKIVGAVQAYNPFLLVDKPGPLTARDRVLVRSLEKTTRMFLLHVVKHEPHNPLAPRLQQHAQRLAQLRSEVLDDATRKWRQHADPNGQSAPASSAAHPSQSQSQAQLQAQSQTQTQASAPSPKPIYSTLSSPREFDIPRLASGPHSLSDVFTLSPSKSVIKDFDAASIPPELVARVNVASLIAIHPGVLTKAIRAVRERLATLVHASAMPLNPDTAPLGVEEDDDDEYEPDFDMVDEGDDHESVHPVAIPTEPMNTHTPDIEEAESVREGEQHQVQAAKAQSLVASAVATALPQSPSSAHAVEPRDAAPTETEPATNDSPQPSETSPMVTTSTSEPPSTQSLVSSGEEKSVGLREFRLPPAPPISPDVALTVGRVILQSVFQERIQEDAAVVSGTSSSAAGSNAGTARPMSHIGWNRLAARNRNRESWMTILIRAVTRAGMGLETPTPSQTQTQTHRQTQTVGSSSSSPDASGSADLLEKLSQLGVTDIAQLAPHLAKAQVSRPSKRKRSDTDGLREVDGRVDGNGRGKVDAESDDDVMDTDLDGHRSDGQNNLHRDTPHENESDDGDDGDDVSDERWLVGAAPVASVVRDCLYTYILEDFRKRIDMAVLWLSEEWYSDQLRRRASVSDAEDTGMDPDPGAKVENDRNDALATGSMHYTPLALRLLDGFLPYLQPQDKVLTRFLSEIPELNRPLLARVKSMCRDPTVVPLALTSLLYLVMMKPPARDLALDTVQDIWREFEDARPLATKYLAKYRPDWLQRQQSLPVA